MADGIRDRKAEPSGTLAPLHDPVFRRIWFASVLANFGQLILGVAAAWEMTRLTTSATMVALVQSALMLPLMLVAVPAGALADIFDRRRVALVGLGFSLICAAGLATLAWFDLASAWILLGFCSLIGTGVAIYAPAWQASIGEQVEVRHLPAAIALGTISYNVARSFGPAIGGAIVLALGVEAAFAISATLYLPLFLAFLLWRRSSMPARLPPEQLGRAIISGVRYVRHSRAIRNVLIRSFFLGLAGASTTALAPLIAKTLLGGGPGTYGLLLGASGAGAVTGALAIGWIRVRINGHTTVAALAVVGGLAISLLSICHSVPSACLCLFVAGGANIITVAFLNISAQQAAPRWVTGRVLSLFSSALTGGVALGAWGWGVIAGHWSIESALIASGVALAATALLGIALPLAETIEGDVLPFELQREPEVALALTARSGPIVIEIDYDVDPASAREFYAAMLELQRTRMRNGAFNWSLSRDIAEAALWTERYQFPTWGDYLQMRSRFTQKDRATQVSANAFDRKAGELRARRRIERPIGSVRRYAESPDLQQAEISCPVS